MTVGRAVARSSKSAVVAELLNDPDTRKYLMKKIGQLMRKELGQMCSEKTKSVLASQF